MEKTAREWIMELNPEHRDLAIENVEKQNEKFLELKFTQLEKVLRIGFNWSKTKEGFDFWRKISNDLCLNTYYDEEAKS
jgi:hypothetical protein